MDHIMVALIIAAGIVFHTLMIVWIWRTRPLRYKRTIPSISIEEMMLDIDYNEYAHIRELRNQI